MKVNGYKQPKSAFLSVDKNLSLIVDKILKNERLKRLLYYTTPDALNRPNITMEQSVEMIGKNIKIVPKFTADHEVLNYIVIKFNNYVPTENPEFRRNIIEFDVVCHFDQWQLNDFSLRPYKIIGELDAMFSDQKLTGIGTTLFAGAVPVGLNDEFAGMCIVFDVVQGEEDKKFMPNPQDEERFQQDFIDYING